MLQRCVFALVCVLSALCAHGLYSVVVSATVPGIGILLLGLPGAHYSYTERY